MFVFLTPRPIAAFKLGDEISARTAGKGKEGAGEADRLKEGEDPNEDLRLPDTTGGSIGSGVVRGVPGLDGAGDAIAMPAALAFDVRWESSGGAGLFDEIRRPGKSILLNLPCVESVQVPSFNLRA